ncbi:MAG: hypothetical protein ABGZ35_26170 [Planctomycetaceae bacterium]
MIDLSTVVSAISEKCLRLVRSVDSIRVEGDCPAELVEAIRMHQVSLLPFAAIAPEAAKEVAEQQAAANSDNIARQLDDFGKWLFTYAPWAAVDLRHSDDIDKRIAAAVDTNDPPQVAATIEALRSHLEILNWAAEVFPWPEETEASGTADPKA